MTDTLNVIFDHDGSPRSIFEGAIEEMESLAVTQMVNEDTDEVVGWIFYDFSRKFRDGRLKDEAILPPTDLQFELDAAPGRSLDIREMAQWAYDNLFRQPVATNLEAR